LEDYSGERLLGDIMDYVGPIDPTYLSEHSYTSQLETIYAILIKPPSKTLGAEDKLIVFFHGTSQHIDFYWARTRLLYATGIPTLIVDYRGYGKSTGTPTVEGILEDGQATLDYIETHLGNPGIFLYANSLGSIVGVEVAASNQTPAGRVEKLILEAPLSSIKSLEEQGGYISSLFMNETNISNVERIKDVHIPLLWLHGQKDEILPIDTHGWPVFNSYQDSNPDLGEYEISPTGTHETTVREIGYPRFVDILKEFFI
jgi:pimeloyl-ACP methyl ester carboxylesterase